MFRVKGFTLLELLVVCAILALLSMLAAPGLLAWVERVKASTLQNTLISSISFSRNAAVSLQSVVTLCPGSINCGQKWGRQLLVFQDSNGNGSLDGDENLLKQIELGKSGESLLWKSFRRKQYLQFNTLGQTRALNGTFHYCPPVQAKNYRFALVLSKTGRARKEKTVSCE